MLKVSSRLPAALDPLPVGENWEAVFQRLECTRFQKPEIWRPESTRGLLGPPNDRLLEHVRGSCDTDTVDTVDWCSLHNHYKKNSKFSLTDARESRADTKCNTTAQGGPAKPRKINI